MEKYKFSKWVEYADFGLDTAQQLRDKKLQQDKDDGENPLKPLNIEYVVNSLKKSAIGSKWPQPNDFFGELQWGEQDGALRLTFTPLAGTRAIVRKLIHDLSGEPTWICKKVLEIKNHFDDKADTLTVTIQDMLTEMLNEGLDAAANDFDNMQRLVIRLAGKLRSRTTQSIFIFEGIRMLKENEEYIIHWGVTGMGRQARGQQRVDQFAIHCSYKKDAGTIKVSGTQIGGKLNNYTWYYNQPSDFCEIFVPAQTEEEIVNAILVLFNTF